MSRHDDVVERLARERGRALVGYAYLLTWDSSAAEDLVQEALVRTFARSRSLDDLWGAEAYVRRTILNLFLDTRRRSTRWGGVRHLVATGDVADDVVTTPEQLDVRRALTELPRRERACVVLRFYDDLTVRQIAERLGISEGAVKRYLSTGVKRLGHLVPDGGTRADGAQRVDPEETEVQIVNRRGLS